MFMARQAQNVEAVYFTGDFCEAGATAACGPGPGGDAAVAQRQITDIITYDWERLQAAMPNVPIFGSLGNHDSVPGDVYYGGVRQRWLYDELVNIWAASVGTRGPAVDTLQRGGYYAVSHPTVPGLTVVSLNVNYHVFQNPEASDVNSLAYSEGRRQLQWLNDTLSAAEEQGHRVHVLGHQPAPFWLPASWEAYMGLLTRYNETVTSQLYGHVHTDQYVITRGCERPAPGSAYVETTGIKWCSGGGDYAPGDVFNAGVDGICPRTPTTWSTTDSVRACESVCTNVTQCVGFTMYFNQTAPASTECCFRTGSTANKPVDANSTARCYEKPKPTCDGAANGVMIPGPSLTEGYPATNPSIRLLEFDRATHRLVDVYTYVLPMARCAGRHATAQIASSLSGSACLWLSLSLLVSVYLSVCLSVCPSA